MSHGSFCVVVGVSPSRGRIDHTESQASNFGSMGVRAALLDVSG